MPRFALIVLALVLAACGSAEIAATTSTTATSSTTTTRLPAPTTTSPSAEPTTTQATTTTTTLQIDLEISGGEVIGPQRFEIDSGDTFDVWVLSDTADELHVHGYDLFFGLSPGEPVNVSFLADVPGIFEVELETDQEFLFDIEVAG